MSFSFYFLNALQSDINSNRVYVLGHKCVLGPSQAHFSPRLAARAKMSLSRAQNIFMPANINSIVILNSVIAKYRDLSVSRRSIICLSLRLRQIIDLLATDKSRYFAQPRPIIVKYSSLALKTKTELLIYICKNRCSLGKTYDSSVWAVVLG